MGTFISEKRHWAQVLVLATVYSILATVYWHLWYWVPTINWIGQKGPLQFIGSLGHYFTPVPKCQNSSYKSVIYGSCNNTENFQNIWKLSGSSGNFPDRLETYQGWHCQTKLGEKNHHWCGLTFGLQNSTSKLLFHHTVTLWHFWKWLQTTFAFDGNTTLMPVTCTECVWLSAS